MELCTTAPILNGSAASRTDSVTKSGVLSEKSLRSLGPGSSPPSEGLAPGFWFEELSAEVRIAIAMSNVSRRGVAMMMSSNSAARSLGGVKRG